MFTHPHITSGIARYRQQEMAAGARQQHLATESNGEAKSQIK